MSSAAGIRLYRDAWGRLVLVDAAGVEHPGVEPVRTFPITDPEHGLSFLSEEGREILFLDTPGELGPDLRELVDEEIRRRQFLPVLLRIVSMSSETEPCEWTVETDRGVTKFVLEDDEDVRRLGPFRTLITDSVGGRYLVPDTRRLDPVSRRILDRYL